MPEGKSEYPADILEITNKLVNDYVNPHGPRPDFRPHLRKLIAAALLAERQRCIEAAEAIQRRSDDYNGAFDGIADVIDAISTPPSSTEES